MFSRHEKLFSFHIEFDRYRYTDTDTDSWRLLKTDTDIDSWRQLHTDTDTINHTETDTQYQKCYQFFTYIIQLELSLTL